MIVSSKRLRLLAISSAIEYNVGIWSRIGNFIGCNKPLSFATADICIRSSNYRRLNQTLLSKPLIQCTKSMTSVGVTVPAKRFSTTTCGQFQQITEEKKLRAAKMKKLHRENKELFGDLLESSSKAKRSKKISTKKKIVLTDESHSSNKDGEVDSSIKLVDNGKSKPVSKKAKDKKTLSSSKKIGKSSKRSLKDEDKDDMNQFFNDPDNNIHLENNGQFREPLPSVNQLMASFCKEDVDTTKKASPKKRSIKVINHDQETEFSLNTNSKKLDNDTLMRSNVCSPSSSSHVPDAAFSANVNSSVNGIQNFTDESSSSSSSSSLSSVKFPFDNPDRLFFEDENLSANPEIISIPFPKKSSSSILTPTNSSESDTVPSIRVPSVSKILSATMPKEQAEALEKWQQKMIAKMGEDGFRKYKQDILNNGTELHSNIYSLLSGKSADQLSISKSISGHWSSLQGILSQVERVHILESHIAHPHLNYCGIVDCIAVFRDKLVVIDWKTSQKPKPYVSMTYDTPLQIAAYIGAINYDPNYSIKVTEGLIAIAYENGHNSQVFHLNPFEVSRYWKMWLDRLQLFQNQAQSPYPLPITSKTSQTTS